jgi:hypothetical protein
MIWDVWLLLSKRAWTSINLTISFLRLILHSHILPILIKIYLPISTRRKFEPWFISRSDFFDQFQAVPTNGSRADQPRHDRSLEDADAGTRILGRGARSTSRTTRSHSIGQSDRCQHTVPRRPGHRADQMSGRDPVTCSHPGGDGTPTRGSTRLGGWPKSCRARAPSQLPSRAHQESRGSRIFPHLWLWEIDHFADKPSTCWWYSFSWIRRWLS